MRHNKDTECSIRETRQITLDKTLADSFPASDPPSTIPDPTYDAFADSRYYLDLDQEAGGSQVSLGMPRFNIALLPVDRKMQCFFADLAQRWFGHVAVGYILEADAVPHVTLCQFRAPDKSVARDAFNSWADKSNINLNLEKFCFRRGNAGNLWVEFLVERDSTLLGNQRECFKHLRRLGLDVLTPVETYSPHITLARVTDAMSFDTEESLVVLLHQGPIDFHPAVGVSTENGVFAKEL